MILVQDRKSPDQGARMKVKIITAAGAIYSAKVNGKLTAEQVVAALAAKYAKDTTYTVVTA